LPFFILAAQFLHRPELASKQFEQTIAPQNLHVYAGLAGLPHMAHKPVICIITPRFLL